MMKRFLLSLLFVGACLLLFAQKRPGEKSVLKALRRANAAFMASCPDPTLPSHVGRERPSHIWTRGVYYEGLMALYDVQPRKEYLDYALRWGAFHGWGFRGGDGTDDADNLCCGQTYVHLARLTGDDSLLVHVDCAMRRWLESGRLDYWTWADAIQMAMPLLAQYGCETADVRFFRRAMELYMYTRDKVGLVGLYNPLDGLWWRDVSFIPPYKEPNGKYCYWSRGNGWVYAALARTLDEMERAEERLPANDRPALDSLRAVWEKDFVTMSMALKACQRADGFWNVSLHDADHYGGPETTGTSLFVYGMAWGLRHGKLSPAVFEPVAVRGWHALSQQALQADGTLGFVQSTGKEPKDGQPLSADKAPDFADFGVGCFLLAGAEMYRWIAR